MAAKVFLIHGWSVRETETYQALHEKLAENGFDLREVYLGRYVSLDNNVEIRDIARAMQRELRRPECLGGKRWNEPFHLITHSTGALVVKQWIRRHYTGRWAEEKPLRNVVFLAGPHFGSRLAHHGRTMVAHAAYRGDTGKRVLHALELGSAFSWENNEAFLDPATWRSKGIRMYSLIGDRVVKNRFNSRIFPAGFEEGSDMVVRVPAGNLNFRRYEIDLPAGKARRVGAVENTAFAALADYTHSGPRHGIMNSIKRRVTPADHQALQLILRCLRVGSAAAYGRVCQELAAVTRKTRRTRQAYAQLDFRFRDQDGSPIEDYSFVLGAMVKGRPRPSRTVAHTHKNRAHPSHLTVFFNLKELEPHLTYFMQLNAESDTDLLDIAGQDHEPKFTGRDLTELICADRTTQIDVILGREPRRGLFVFHRGDDSDLHLRWSRSGQIVKRGIPPS